MTRRLRSLIHVLALFFSELLSIQFEPARYSKSLCRCCAHQINGLLVVVLQLMDDGNYTPLDLLAQALTQLRKTCCFEQKIGKNNNNSQLPDQLPTPKNLVYEQLSPKTYDSHFHIKRARICSECLEHLQSQLKRFGHIGFLFLNEHIESLSSSFSFRNKKRVRVPHKNYTSVLKFFPFLSRRQIPSPRHNVGES